MRDIPYCGLAVEGGGGGDKEDGIKVMLMGVGMRWECASRIFNFRGTYFTVWMEVLYKIH